MLENIERCDRGRCSGGDRHLRSLLVVGTIEMLAYNFVEMMAEESHWQLVKRRATTVRNA